MTVISIAAETGLWSEAVMASHMSYLWIFNKHCDSGLEWHKIRSVYEGGRRDALSSLPFFLVEYASDGENRGKWVDKMIRSECFCRKSPVLLQSKGKHI